MRRVLSILVLAAFAGVAVADIPPPPPPKGKKYVLVSNEVALGKDVTGYVFVKQVTSFPGMPEPSYAKLELKADKPTAIPEGGRRTFVTLFAVPEDVAKAFKTDADMFAAIGTGKLKGAQKIGFNSTATVSDKVKGDSVKWTTTITGIDAKGIKTKVEGDGHEEPKTKPKDGKNNSPNDEDDSQTDAPVATTQTPRGGVLIAGIAATLAVMLGGFWLAGRTRRKV